MGKLVIYIPHLFDISKSAIASAAALVSNRIRSNTIHVFLYMVLAGVLLSTCMPILL